MRRALVALAALVLAGCGSRGSEPKAAAGASPAGTPSADAFRPLAVGDRVPTLALRTLAGDSLRVEAGGPVTLVNVWATWCSSCREEMADLEALHRDFGPRGLRVVAVSVDDGDGTRVRRFVARQRLTMRVAHDPAQQVQALYQVMAVPETYLMGRDGRLLWRQTGGLHGAPEVARSAVTKALEGSSRVASARR